MTDSFEELFRRSDRARRENRLEDSRRGLTEALRICRGRGSEQHLVRALKGDSETAKRLLREARDLYAASGVPVAVAECETRLADEGDERR